MQVLPRYDLFYPQLIESLIQKCSVTGERVWHSRVDEQYLSMVQAQTPRRSYLDSASYLDAYVIFDMVTPEPPLQVAALRPVTGRPF